MTPNPFTDYLPLYGPGVVAERPWWRLSGAGFVRSDGVPFPDFSGLHEWTEELALVAQEPFVSALARIDTEHPLPAPKPLAGQVWAWPEGEAHIVGKVYGRDVGGAMFANGPSYRADEWPPAGGVLVAGPTPWGRDVPWAPSGWKP